MGVRKTHRTHGKTMVEQKHQKNGKLGLQPQKKILRGNVCVVFFFGGGKLLRTFLLGFLFGYFFPARCFGELLDAP